MKLSDMDSILAKLDDVYHDLGSVEYDDGYSYIAVRLFLQNPEVSGDLLDKIIVFVCDMDDGGPSSFIKGTLGSLIFYHNNMYEAVNQRIRQYETDNKDPALL